MSLDDYKFNVESAVQIIDEAYELWQEHHNELVGEDVKFLPDFEKYKAVEKNGYLKVYTVRYKKKLVGYAVFIALPHHHRVQVIQAENTLFFLTKEHRKGLLASKFIRWCEEQLFGSGVSQISMRTKVRASFGILLKRLKYQEEEVVYMKKKKE
jgi:hypothetical protein